MPVVDLIAAKRGGAEIDSDRLRELVLGFARDEVPDYQMAAFMMAGCLRGFSHAEAIALTDAMLASGDRLDLSSLAGPTVDKHSTGGVADGTTLVVAPLAAELGMQVLKLSGRGLGHTGGTLDKLDAIPGMRTELTIDEMLAQAADVGLVIGAQTAQLVPADRKMYALRDVTATVADPALIASSVMSKKLAGGASDILLDVKTGSGAFMTEPGDAADLARLCVSIGTDAGRRTAALVTDMNQPLGDLVGNAVEIVEAVEVLGGERPGRFAELCVELTGRLAALTGIAADTDAGRERARRAIDDGSGLERFRRWLSAQGGDPRVVDDLSLLPQPPVRTTVTAPRAGRLHAVDCAAIGRAAAGLGAGRQELTDAIDPSVGLELHVHLGDELDAGDAIVDVLARSEDDARRAGAAVLAALTVDDAAAQPPPLVHEVIGFQDTATTGSPR